MINAVPDERGQSRLIAQLDIDHSIAESFGPPRLHPTPDGVGGLVYPPPRTDPGVLTPRNPSALAYRFDIVLRGPGATPFESKAPSSLLPRPVGPCSVLHCSPRG